MTLSVGDAVGDGLDRLTDGRLAAAFVAFYAAHLALTVGTQSQLAAQRETFEEEAFLFDPELLPPELPLALEIPLGAAILLWTLAMVALVTSSILALRALLGAERPGPRTDGLLVATVHGVVAGIAAGIAVGIGLALFVLPGLFLATVLAFTYPYVALEGENALSAMRRSWSLTTGNRLRVFAVVVVIGLTFFSITFVGGVVALALGAFPLLAEVTNVAFVAIAWLASLAILASAFDQLEAARAEAEAKWDGIDDELLP